jgi:2-(1,2-epoxy-1,2-dihydrophenyl)acetyl-CoA isomerase
MSDAVATDVVRTALERGVLWIRLNRPDSMNAVNADLRKALAAAVRDAERNPEVRAVVVTGTGRAFCSGADVREFANREGAVEQIAGEYHKILNGLRTMPKPTIAAMNGVAAGIGASIAMACDLRFATPEASLVEAFVKIGLTPDGGATWFLPRFIGTAKALEVMYTGDPLKAEEAERLGLYNRVLPAAELEAVVRELAERLATGPTMALAAAKRSVNFGADVPFEEAVDFEFLLQGVQMQGEDFKEGVAAFLEKRKPQFKGE